MDKEVIEIMPLTGSKEDEETALLQKRLIDELTGVGDSGAIKEIIDQELKKTLK